MALEVFSSHQLTQLHSGSGAFNSIGERLDARADATLVQGSARPVVQIPSGIDRCALSVSHITRYLKWLATPTLVALTACATTPPPAVEVRYQRVEVPVAVHCVDKTKVPAKPAPIASQLTGDPVHDLDLVTAKAKRLSAWGDELAAMLVGC